MFRSTAILALLLAGVLPSGAYAKSVGVNFVAGKPAKQKLHATDKAGATKVAQIHWNNVVIGHADGNGHWNGGKFDKLFDNSGEAVKGLKITVSTGPGHKAKVWPAKGAPWGFKGPNLTLQRALIWPHPVITVTGIPYAHYKVYVYVSAGGSGGTGSATIAAVKGAKGHVASTNTYFYHFGWTGGHFKAAKATDAKTADKTKSNYVCFKGNFAHGFTMTFNGAVKGSWTGISGIQIVATSK